MTRSNSCFKKEETNTLLRQYKSKYILPSRFYQAYYLISPMQCIFMCARACVCVCVCVCAFSFLEVTTFHRFLLDTYLKFDVLVLPSSLNEYVVFHATPPMYSQGAKKTISVVSPTEVSLRHFLSFRIRRPDTAGFFSRGEVSRQGEEPRITAAMNSER